MPGFVLGTAQCSNECSQGSGVAPHRSLAWDGTGHRVRTGGFESLAAARWLSSVDGHRLPESSVVLSAQEPNLRHFTELLCSLHRAGAEPGKVLPAGCQRP